MDALMGGQGLSKSFEEGYGPAEIKQEPVGYTPSFVRYRMLVFAGLVLGYSCYYITRNSFIYTAPVMVEAGVLTMTQVSVLSPQFRSMHSRVMTLLVC
jgi:sugar phosphate permease